MPTLNSPGDQACEERRPIGGDHQTAADEEQVEHEQDRGADQSELLPEHREDEVGVLLREEIEVRLRAVEPALADHASRTERDRGLRGVVARAQRIARGIEEREDALALVAVQVLQHERRPGTGNGDEFDRLTQVFNAMTSRLEQSFQRIRQFTLHASHELKTPLTVLRAEAETGLQDASLSPSQRQRLESQLDKQAQQLKDSQRKVSELQDKIDSLADIERTLPQRPRTTRPAGGGK